MTTGQRGSHRLIVGGYAYVKNHMSLHTISWKCAKKVIMTVFCILRCCVCYRISKKKKKHLEIKINL